MSDVVAVAIITAVPSTISAVLSGMAHTKAKQAATIASAALDQGVANGAKADVIAKGVDGLSDARAALAGQIGVTQGKAPEIAAGGATSGGQVISNGSPADA